MCGELARDRDGDNGPSLAAAFECLPALVEAVGALVGAGADGCGLSLSAPLERRARAQRAPRACAFFCVSVGG